MINWKLRGPEAAKSRRSFKGKLRKSDVAKFSGKLTLNKPVEFKYSYGFHFGLST